MKNPYEILGININATLTEIKEAHRKLAKKFHSDVNDGDTFFEEHFKRAQDAYEMLCDEQKRNKLNQELANYNKAKSQSKVHKDKVYQITFERIILDSVKRIQLHNIILQARGMKSWLRPLGNTYLIVMDTSISALELQNYLIKRIKNIRFFIIEVNIKNKAGFFNKEVLSVIDNFSNSSF